MNFCVSWRKSLNFFCACRKRNRGKGERQRERGKRVTWRDLIGIAVFLTVNWFCAGQTVWQALLSAAATTTEITFPTKCSNKLTAITTTTQRREQASKREGERELQWWNEQAVRRLLLQPLATPHNAKQSRIHHTHKQKTHKHTHCSSCCCCYCLITRMAPLTVLEFISIAFHTEGGALWCFYLLIARAHNGSCTHPHHTHTHAYMDKHRHTLVFASAEYRNRFWWNTLQHTQLPAHTHTVTYVMTHSTYTYLNNMCTHTHTRTNTKLKTHARKIAFCSFSVFAHKTCTLPPGGVREACVI